MSVSAAVTRDPGHGVLAAPPGWACSGLIPPPSLPPSRVLLLPLPGPRPWFPGRTGGPLGPGRAAGSDAPCQPRGASRPRLPARSELGSPDLQAAHSRGPPPAHARRRRRPAICRPGTRHGEEHSSAAVGHSEPLGKCRRVPGRTPSRSLHSSPSPSERCCRDFIPARTHSAQEHSPGFCTGKCPWSEACERGTRQHGHSHVKWTEPSHPSRLLRGGMVRGRQWEGNVGACKVSVATFGVPSPEVNVPPQGLCTCSQGCGGSERTMRRSLGCQGEVCIPTMIMSLWELP